MLELLFGGVTYLGVSRGGVGLFRPTRSPWRRDQQTTAEAAFIESESGLDSTEHVAVAVRSLVDDAKARGTRTSVVLHDPLVRLYMVKPASNTRCLQDCVDAAKARFHALYGDLDLNWDLRGDWKPAVPFLVCATPKSLLHALSQAIDACELVTLQLVPRFIASWNRIHSKMQAGDWLLVSDAGNLSIGVTGSAGLCGVRSLAVPANPGTQPGWLSDLLNQMAAHLEVCPPQCVHLLGELEPVWRDSLRMRVVRPDPEVDSRFAKDPSALVQLAMSGHPA